LGQHFDWSGYRMSEMKKFEFKFEGKAYTVEEDAPQAYAVSDVGASQTPLMGPTHWRIFDSLRTEIPADFHSDGDQAEVVAQAKDELKKFFDTTTLDQGS